MKLKRIVSLLLALVMSLSVLVGCGSNDNGSNQETDSSQEASTDTQENQGEENENDEASADQEDHLTVYSSLSEDEASYYFDAFTEETGIDVSFIHLSAGEALTRIRAEKENPQASVWFGGSTDNYINAANEDLLLQYQPENVDELPEQYLDENGYWTPIYVGALGFATNTESGLDSPETWEDLLEDEYNDQIMMAHPASSGTAYTVLATLVQLMGEDEAMEYLQGLDANIRQYTTSGSAPATQAGLGEAGVGISFSHDILSPQAEGYPIELSFPSEGTGYEVGATAIINNGLAEEADAAKKFIDWISTSDAQSLMATSGAMRIPVHPDADTPEGGIPLSEIDTIDYDAQWAAENRDRLIERFNSDVRGESEAVEV